MLPCLQENEGEEEITALVATETNLAMIPLPLPTCPAAKQKSTTPCPAARQEEQLRPEAAEAATSQAR